MKRIADGEPWTTPPTIDDAGVLDEIGASLKDRGSGGRQGAPGRVAREVEAGLATGSQARADAPPMRGRSQAGAPHDRPPVRAPAPRRPHPREPHHRRADVPVLGPCGPGRRLAPHASRADGDVGGRAAHPGGDGDLAGGADLAHRPRALLRRDRAGAGPGPRRGARLRAGADRDPDQPCGPQGLEPRALGRRRPDRPRGAGRLAHGSALGPGARGGRGGAPRPRFGRAEAHPRRLRRHRAPGLAPGHRRRSSCTGRTATCCTSSCRRSPTSAPTSMAAARQPDALPARMLRGGARGRAGGQAGLDAGLGHRLGRGRAGPWRRRWNSPTP